MALEFTTMQPAGRFSDACEFPIMDLRPMMKDQVLASLPRFIGRWEDGTTMEVLLDDNYTYIEAADECDFVEARRETLGCTVLIPDQGEIMVGEKNVKFRQLMNRFCKARNMVRYPTLFNADGSLDMGQPLVGVFLTFLLAELRGPFLQRLITSAWTGNGDDANYFTGMLTQLEDPETWVDSGIACSRYRPNVLDWNVAVNGASPGQPFSFPADTIAASGDAYVINGQSFTGLTGLDLVRFLKLWIERLIDYDLSMWSEEAIVFELWMPPGQTNCIAELAACMQPCGGCPDPLSDPRIRDRASEFQRDRVIWLYPYDNIRIVLRTSPALVNRMIFVPISVGGKPLAGWVFRDQDEELQIVNGELPFYGAQPGLPDDNMLYPGSGPIDGGEFEQRAFSLHVERNGDCVDFWLKTEAGMLLFGLNLWLIIEGVSCVTLTPGTITSVMSYAVDEDGCTTADDYTLVLTMTSLNGNTTHTGVGAIFAVYWAEGQVLMGTVSAWDDLTDELTLSFPETGPIVSCSLSSDVASTNTPVQIVYKGG